MVCRRRKGCLRRIKTVGTFKVVRHFHLNEWNPSYQRKMNANGDLPSGQTLEAQSSDHQSRQPSASRPNPRPTLLNFCSSSATVSAASSFFSGPRCSIPVPCSWCRSSSSGSTCCVHGIICYQSTFVRLNIECRHRKRRTNAVSCPKTPKEKSC